MKNLGATVSQLLESCNLQCKKTRFRLIYLISDYNLYKYLIPKISLNILLQISSLICLFYSLKHHPLSPVKWSMVDTCKKGNSRSACKFNTLLHFPRSFRVFKRKSKQRHQSSKLSEKSNGTNYSHTICKKQVYQLKTSVHFCVQ